MKLGLINTLTAQIIKLKNITRSEAMRMAYAVLRGEKATKAESMLFIKKDGTVTRRVVCRNWFDFSAPKGGASKPGHIIMADLAKVAAGLDRCIISTTPEQIIQNNSFTRPACK